MENSSSQSYTSMMNSSLSPSDPQSPNFLQNTQNQMSQQYPNFHPSHMNYPTPPFNPSFQPHYPHHANLYGAPGSYQPISPMHPSYHGVPYHGSGGMYPPGAYGAGSSNNPSSPVGCMPFLGVVGGTGSRGDESSSPGVSHTMSPPYPVSPAYPMSPVYPMSQDPASNNEEGSESSPDETEKKGKSKSWSKHEDELLIASWLHNSCDSIHGNSKRSENYWKEVAAELNKYAAKGEKKTVMQCKNHWTKTTKKVTKFNGIYNVERTMWPSGANDHDLMEKVRAKYKIAANTKRPFAYEHWWKLVKNEAKWKSSYSIQDMNKKNMVKSSGAHSSSSQATDEEVVKKPMGRNKARAQEKSTSKSKFSSGSITNETVDQFNEIQLRKTVAAEKMADATLIQAETQKGRIETEKERIKFEKLNKYLDLLHKDTSGYDVAQKNRHDQVVDFLARELFG